jgi:hypothetical protein
MARKATWVVAALLTLGYAAVLLRFSPAPLQDYPNHVARALVMNDLLFHGGARFGAAFEFHFMAAPYILSDVLLAAAIELLGVRWASDLWSLLVFMAIPAALLAYMRVTKVRREDWLPAFLLSLYLAANTFYVRGFVAFELAVAMVILLVALMAMMRERFSPLLWAAYCSLLGLAYLTHLSALIFAAVALSATVLTNWRRNLNIRVELSIAMPIAALLAWHFLLRSPASAPTEAGYVWGTPTAKLQHLFWIFMRFSARADLWMLCLCLGCVLVQVARRPRQGGAAERRWAIENLIMASAFAALYVALPMHLGVTSWIDVRALPFIAIFCVLATLMPAGLPESPQGAAGTVLGLLPAALLAAVNLAYLNLHFGRLEARLAEYRAVAAKAAPQSWVLPIYTNTRDRPVKSMLHAAAFTLLDRGALNPYFFSADQGHPMEYFRYRRRPYAPDENWYIEPAEAVDWRKVADSYAFLLVMKPYEPARIPIATTLVFENAGAALLAVDSSRINAR